MQLAQLPKFCFPYHDSADAALQPQLFSFTLTDGEGWLQFGFCLQNEPATPASAAELICIVSHQPWFEFFQDLLRYANRLWQSPKVLRGGVGEGEGEGGRGGERGASREKQAD